MTFTAAIIWVFNVARSTHRWQVEAVQHEHCLKKRLDFRNERIAAKSNVSGERKGLRK
jgi:hypothetical protein